MSCTSPLKGFYTFQQSEEYLPDIEFDYKNDKYKTTGELRKRSNRKIKVTSYNVDHLELIGSNLIKKYESNISPDAKAVYKDYIEIPCGKCISCRLKRSRDWANRCMLELPYHEHSYFVTLTYDDEHVNYNYIFDDYGNYVPSLTLKKKDLQDFFKRLRKKYKYDNHIKYYACGEYGDDTHRPHYHAIIFGLQIDDLIFYKKSRLGFNYYTSEWLSSIWKNGYVVITDVSWETCAYTARYIMKKQFGYNANIYDVLEIEPEFTTMSLKPAIGLDYFKEHKEHIYDIDNIYIKTESGGKKFKPPKYFDKKMSEDYYDSMKLEEVRTVRQLSAELTKKNKLSQTDLSYEKYLEVENDLLETRLKALPRKEI